MPRYFSSLLLTLVVVSLTACFEPIKDTHPQQLVTKRKEIFKNFVHTLEPIAMVASEREEFKPHKFLLLAQDLERLSTQPWVYFTPDGNYPPTHARPTVWQKPAVFKQAQENYQDSVRQLVKAAQDGNLDMIKVTVNRVVISCKSCHNQFRYNL